MIEMIFVIGAAFWFAKEANSIGKSGILWAFIAIAGYYIPVLFFSILIFPLIFSGIYDPHNVAPYQILTIVLNIIAGVGSLLIIRKKILKLSANIDKENEKVLEKKRKNRISLESIENYDSIIGLKCYNKNTDFYAGKITEIDIQNRKCIVKGNFDKVSEYNFDMLLIDK